MKNQFVIILIFTVFLSLPVNADDKWKFTTAAQGTLLDYSGSQFRSSVWETGGLVLGDYLDDGGFTLGYTRTTINFKQELPAIDQDTYYASVRKHFYFDALPGILTLRADGYIINNNDTTDLTDAVNTWMTLASFISRDKNYYGDFGYTRSEYHHLTINQYTPTVGLSLFQDEGWLQVRGYFMDYSNAKLSEGLKSSQAGEVKYTHFLTPGKFYKPNNLQLGGVFGNRLYAVDMDAATIANYSDIQRGGFFLGSVWTFGSATKLLFMGGQNTYLNKNINDHYEGRFLYLNVNTTF